MADVRFLLLDGEQGLEDWRCVHNEIIPTDPLSLDEVRGRGFMEVERYLLPGATVPYVALTLPD